VLTGIGGAGGASRRFLRASSPQRPRVKTALPDLEQRQTNRADADDGIAVTRP